MSMRPVVAWTIIVAVILLLALFVVSMFVPWTPINCRHEDVDITTGRLRHSRYFLFCKVSERIEDSPVTKMLPPDILRRRTPEWRRVNTFSPGVHHSPRYTFHGAIHQIHTLVTVWDMANEYGFSDELKQKTALDVLAIWQQSGSCFLAGDYIRCLRDLADEATRQRILTALPKLKMPLVETNGTDVVSTMFFPNGQPMDRIHGYVDKHGKFIRHGVWERWAKDGTRVLHGHFENGERHGRRFEWDYDGKLSSINVYNHGELIEYASKNLEDHPDFKAAQQLSERDGVSAARDPNTVSDAQALEIAEATFRYQFLHNASGRQQEAAAYFLSLFGQDPDDAFLKRFEGHKPPIQKGSAFVVGKGLKFRVERIKRVSDTKVEVSGGYYEAGLSSSGNTYIVELKEGKWVVTGDTMHWISWNRETWSAGALADVPSQRLDVGYCLRSGGSSRPEILHPKLCPRNVRLDVRAIEFQ